MIITPETRRLFAEIRQQAEQAGGTAHLVPERPDTSRMQYKDSLTFGVAEAVDLVLNLPVGALLASVGGGKGIAALLGAWAAIHQVRRVTIKIDGFGEFKGSARDARKFLEAGRSEMARKATGTDAKPPKA